MPESLWNQYGALLRNAHEIKWATCARQECKLCLRMQAEPALRLLATCLSYSMLIPKSFLMDTLSERHGLKLRFKICLKLL